MFQPKDFGRNFRIVFLIFCPSWVGALFEGQAVQSLVAKPSTAKPRKFFFFGVFSRFWRFCWALALLPVLAAPSFACRPGHDCARRPSQPFAIW